MLLFSPRLIWCIPLLWGFLTPLVAQEAATSKAFSLHYAGALLVSNPEPSADGEREVDANLISAAVEFRRAENFGWLAGLTIELLQTRRTAALAPTALAPFAMLHPYASRLTHTYLWVGGQYNFRVASGDLSLALTVGPGAGRYVRSYDDFRENKINFGTGLGTEYLLGVRRFRSRYTLRARATGRLQYTRWFSPQLALSIGMEYGQSHYVSGGRTTGRGTRYVYAYSESFTERDQLFNVNYDRTTLAPDPSKVLHQLNATIGFHQRIGR